MTIDHKEILHEILFDKHLTEDEHSLLDDLIENRLYQLNLREDDPSEEIKQLQNLYIKLGKIAKKEHGK